LFIIKHDKNGSIKFASLQSQAAKDLLAKKGFDNTGLNSIIFIEGNHCYTKSEATIQIARRLSGLPHYLKWIQLIPRSIRDFAYDRIAKNRYRFFGKRDACMIPTAELSNRFID
jgi:predicted DCC family thiol-disulfide oxidoreductase YuxK